MTSFWAVLKYLILVYDVFLSSFRNLILVYDVFLSSFRNLILVYDVFLAVLKPHSSLWRLSEQF